MESLNHTRRECKYHFMFIYKYRKKVLYGQIRRYLGEILKEVAKQKGSEIEEGHVMPDHVHMLSSIPPKFPVSKVFGHISNYPKTLSSPGFYGGYTPFSDSY